MAQIAVTVNGRRYEIGCDDGEEAHVFRMAAELDRRVSGLVASVGQQVGEARLLVLAGLLLADEANDLRQQLVALQPQPQPAQPASDGAAAAGGGAEGRDGADVEIDGEALDAELRSLAERIEGVAERLAAGMAVAEDAPPS